VERRQDYLEPETEIAGYRIQSLIARGGMGVVYRAFDIQLNRPVALKLLAPELSANEKFRQRFIRESKLAASVDHPNILPIYGAGEWSGLLYIAMRYVRGTDLKAEIDVRGPLSLTESLRILTEVADALDAAHAAGLVHRDVKPGNVLLSEDRVDGHRHVYLTDFGLTKRTTSATGVTTAGHFLGTLDYVAPEQIRGEDVDGRVDVYALACLAYTLFTGHPPFEHDDDSAQLWAHVAEEPPRLSRERPDIPISVELAIVAGMAKQRDDRPPTCGALVAMMSDDAFTGGPPPWAFPTDDANSEIGPVAALSDDGGTDDASAPARFFRASGRHTDPSRAAGPAHRRTGSGRWEEAPRRRRARWPVALGAVVVLLCAAGLLFSPMLPWNKPVPFRAEGVPFTLNVPHNWGHRTSGTGDSTVSVLSEYDLTALFADQPGAPALAAEQVAEDPSSVVGVAVYHGGAGRSGQSASANLVTAEALLPGGDATLRDQGEATVGDVEGQRMEGTIPLSDTATLQVQVFVVETDPVGFLVFFAPVKLFDEHREVFDEVADSLRRKE
jgi:serine/threonine protein kinase